MKKHKNTNRILMAFLLVNLFVGSASAMAKKPLNPEGDAVVTPAPKPDSPAGKPPSREPAAIVDSITPEGFSVFQEVAYPVGSVVDTNYKSYRELIPMRDAQQSYRTDNCDIALENKDRFAERIAYAVELKMQPTAAKLGYVASYFGMSSDVKSYLPNSLISHPLCNVTSATLNTTLSGKNVPSAATIAKANEFADRMNAYRREALAGQRDGYVKASKLWSKFMMCLSYMESLTTADTTKSQNVAQKYSPPGYRRPAGVKFYEDPAQPAVSRLNIGLFQFTPDSGGNVQACIREWNEIYPNCEISPKASQAELIKVLGSSLQTFNSFCAASKVTGMFAVQINSAKASNTHPYNVKADGKLKAPADRCVSPHMAVGRSYNHFGPLQNSSGFTLDTVLSCTLNGEY